MFVELTLGGTAVSLKPAQTNTYTSSFYLHVILLRFYRFSALSNCGVLPKVVISTGGKYLKSIVKDRMINIFVPKYYTLYTNTRK